MLAQLISALLLAASSTALAVTPPEDEELLEELLSDDIDAATSAPAVIDADRPLPPNAVRVINYFGVLDPAFVRRSSCVAEACTEMVINRQTGKILFIDGVWQPGSVRTGFGQEVITVKEPEPEQGGADEPADTP